MGTTLTLNSVARLMTYAWSGSNSFTASTLNPSIENVTAAANGTYTLTVTNANGCSASASNVSSNQCFASPKSKFGFSKMCGYDLDFECKPNVSLNGYYQQIPTLGTSHVYVQQKIQVLK
ncbi:MAG: hypothetical protein U5N85_00240 [Arcicella sp.]|nr:hypothetical protein [Arcicella sp.]